jgi:hypothetical protein
VAQQYEPNGHATNAPSQPPPVWSVTTTPDALDIALGESAVADVDITAPEGTAVAVAVRATNVENGDQHSVSGVVIVARGMDGTFALLYAAVNRVLLR